MQMAPETWDKDTILALIKLVTKLVALGALIVAGTDGAATLAESNLNTSQKAADAQNTKVLSWESFDDMVHYYEGRVAALEQELDACSH